ncbi:peripheral plasma membrane protein CASK-like [Diaphorina citri]|uniref:Peripheral plasma membrane protein CASK-like n=1 Tax=Diaphorina citri TaxID=121845 RepID=A0A3Q0J424_DIACI|nr:peripheral plasma membrane protein CASK-like [Diaphorina citri]
MLKHPHVVELLETYSSEGMLYMVFEYMDGSDICFEIVRRATAGFVYSEAVASHYMRQVLEALRYCHENDIIHRDIKPHCVLLANKENSAPVKLGGFGVAIQLQDGQLYCSGGHRIGTPHYMAPEVIEDQKYGKPVDIWAAGVLLHVLLTGTLPFVGSRDRLFQSITKGKLHVISRLDLTIIATRESITDSLCIVHLADCVEELKKFNVRRRLKGAVLNAISSPKWNATDLDAQDHFSDCGEDELTSSAISMILESLDDIECLQEQLYEDKTMMNSLLEDKQLHILLELYDKISSKVISPNRTPPSDVVTRCRDALDIIRDFERSVSPTDVELDLSGDFEELKQILTSPHFKVREPRLIFCSCRINFRQFLLPFQLCMHRSELSNFFRRRGGKLNVSIVYSPPNNCLALEETMVDVLFCISPSLYVIALFLQLILILNVN